MLAQDNRDYLLLRAYRAGITDSRELAVFMGQMEVESGGFEALHENLNYSGLRLLQVFPGRNGIDTEEKANAIAQGGPEAVANAIYGGEWGRQAGGLGNTEPGDGWRFHGRGYVQLTGRDNYTRTARELGIDLAGNPDLAAERKTAADIALHYWNDRVRANGYHTSISGSTRAINGGYTHIAERSTAVARWERALTVEVMVALERGEVLLPATSTRHRSADLVVSSIQRNLNDLEITDARGQALVVDGIRGGPGSRTNEAIAAFLKQTSLPSQLSREQTPAELLAATEAALEARQPMRRFNRTMAAFASIVPEQAPAPRMVNGMPDFLLPGIAQNPSTPAPAASPQETPAVPHSLPARLQAGDRGPAVQTLQEQLHTLNARDAQGQALKPDGEFGLRTRQAIEQFQLWTGRKPTGIADPDTLKALQSHAQFATQRQRRGLAAGEHLTDNLQPTAANLADAADPRPMQTLSTTPLPPPPVPRNGFDQHAGQDAALRSPHPFSDPRHPQHALYSELKGHLPAHVSESRLAQFTAAARVAGIKPGQLASIDINAERALFTSQSDGTRAIVDMGKSSPPILESLQRTQAFDRDQAEQNTRHQAAQPQQAPPMQH